MLGTIGEKIGYSVEVQISDKYHMGTYWSGLAGWGSTGPLSLEKAKEFRDKEIEKGRNAWIVSVHTGHSEPTFLCCNDDGELIEE